MTPKMLERLHKALQDARKEGYNVIGFAVKPDEDGMVILNNHQLPKEEFTAMMDMALEIYEGQIQSAGNA